MRVLLLSQNYDPEPVVKVHDLARGLTRLGHSVQVVTSFPCYPLGRIYPGYRQALVAREQRDGVRVVRIPQISDHSRSALKRAVHYLSFGGTAATLGPGLAKGAQVIYAYLSALPVGLAAWVISRVRGIPFVVDVVDLWPESVIASGMLRNRAVEGLLRRTARFIYSRAAHVCVVTEGYRDNLLRLGIPEDKISVIHNWVPGDSQRGIVRPPEAADEERLRGRFNVMFAGNMGPCQSLRTVLEAAAVLHDLPEVQFVLVGDGVEHPQLLEWSRATGLRNVLFLGRRPPEMMAGLFDLADILLVHLKPDPLTEISIPSKTFAYMASGKPVLMAARGEGARFVEQNGFGVAVEPMNPGKLAEAVRRLHAACPEERKRLGTIAEHLYEDRFCSAVQVERVSSLLTMIALRRQT